MALPCSSAHQPDKMKAGPWHSSSLRSPAGLRLQPGPAAGTLGSVLAACVWPTVRSESRALSGRPLRWSGLCSRSVCAQDLAPRAAAPTAQGPIGRKPCHSSSGGSCTPRRGSPKSRARLGSPAPTGAKARPLPACQGLRASPGFPGTLPVTAAHAITGRDGESAESRPGTPAGFRPGLREHKPRFLSPREPS